MLDLRRMKSFQQAQKIQLNLYKFESNQAEKGKG